ncbi:hypothetical protein MSLAZ_2083 [Methanosarcina lacustris Z-7289]|uniref:Uncharacterized protein n=1 Tax=Methanosarcina lacustris Z-7289 TaxID=1434111 RepID=A0A0E3S375_9EURY|nr:hypothetical protein MSLAZ_2083 [Methanosarcina lacustris Z-7289]
MLEAVFQHTNCGIALLYLPNSVSILVLLEAVFQPKKSRKLKEEMATSFNPCFAGSCFSTLKIFVFQMRKTVSILVLLEAVFQQSDGIVVICGDFVSILVLLEAVFQLFNEDTEKNWGYIVSILVLLEAVFQRGALISLISFMLFQSLFCWKLFFNSRLEKHTKICCGFQSLFCWKLFFNFLSSQKTIVFYHCFNPCFAGSCFSTAYEPLPHAVGK